jgi:GxxExxY protein
MHPPFFNDSVNSIFDMAETVFDQLGGGLFERIYEEALGIECQHRGVLFESQPPFKVKYRGQVIGLFRPDLIIDDTVIVLVRCCPDLQEFDFYQLSNHMNLAQIKTGVLFNFYNPGLEGHYYEMRENGIQRMGGLNYCPEPDFNELDPLDWDDSEVELE